MKLPDLCLVMEQLAQGFLCLLSIGLYIYIYVIIIIAFACLWRFKSYPQDCLSGDLSRMSYLFSTQNSFIVKLAKTILFVPSRVVNVWIQFTELWDYILVNWWNFCFSNFICLGKVASVHKPTRHTCGSSGHGILNNLGKKNQMRSIRDQHDCVENLQAFWDDKSYFLKVSREKLIKRMRLYIKLEVNAGTVSIIHGILVLKTQKIHNWRSNGAKLKIDSLSGIWLIWSPRNSTLEGVASVTIDILKFLDI